MRYIWRVIVSIQHKGLKLLWTKNGASKLPQEQVKKLTNILTLLDAAHDVKDMQFPGANLHLLKGDLKGFWAVMVTGNYRIIFQFEAGDAYLVNYLDYH